MRPCSHETRTIFRESLGFALRIGWTCKNRTQARSTLTFNRNLAAPCWKAKNETVLFVIKFHRFPSLGGTPAVGKSSHFFLLIVAFHAKAVPGSSHQNQARP